MELRTAKGRLFVLILLFLVFPLLNGNFNIVKSAPLNGIWLANKPAFSYKAWWNGSYQEAMNKHLNDSVGFRADMIRFDNQIDFTFFKQLNAGDMILGKHNDLFYKDYVAAYCGTDYASDNYPINILVKMKKVQDTLERLGKTFVFVHSASKVSYAPEDIPEDIPCNSGGKTNIKNYMRIGDSLGIHQLDFNSWYASLKGKTEHPLFNPQGIHWTLYGALWAVDSLISYIEQRRNIHMLHPIWSEIVHTAKTRLHEDDMESILNFMFPMDTSGYWYPKWHYADKSGKGYTKPRVVYIGDSFIGTLDADGMMNSDTAAEYWFYFRDVWVEDKTPLTYDNMGSYNFVKSSGDMNAYHWQEVMLKADCIVVMYTAAKLVKEGDAFINKAYEYFYPKEDKQG